MNIQICIALIRRICPADIHCPLFLLVLSLSIAPFYSLRRFSPPYHKFWYSSSNSSVLLRKEFRTSSSSWSNSDMTLFIVLSGLGGEIAELFIKKGYLLPSGKTGDSPSPSEEIGETPCVSRSTHGCLLVCLSPVRERPMLTFLPSWGL